MSKLWQDNWIKLRDTKTQRFSHKLKQMKNYGILAFSLLVGTCINAQTLEGAIKKTDNERYEAAAADFKALIAKEPAKADNYFYYGENFVQLEELDSANIMWKKGLSVDPASALNMVGIGKYLWYKGDTTAAKQQFTAALTATKNKNANIMREIAEVYIYAPTKSLKQAVTTLNAAIKLEPKNIEGHLLLGDALLELNPQNASEAMKSYNNALDLEKTPKIIVRKAKVYQRAENYQLANDMYKEAQDMDATYAPAYRENAELNMKFNQSNRAIENWLKYMELNNSTYARYRYAISLYTGKRYCEAIPEFETIHKDGFENFYTQRLLAYSVYECFDKDTKADSSSYRKAMIASDKFFKLAPEDKIIGLDYKYKGLILSKMGKDSLAIDQLNKAIDKDPANSGELMGELSKLYSKAKKYDLVIDALNKKMGSDSTKLTIYEYLDLGKAYYFGPKNYVLADSAYARVAKLSPTYAVAYLWRARAQIQLDPKKITWSAKPHYEKLLETVPVADRMGPYKPYLIEAAKYLGDYYVNSKEKNSEKAKEVWNLVRELDPQDKQAKAFFGVK